MCVHWGLSLAHHQRPTDFDRVHVCGGPLFWPPSTSACVQNRSEFVELGGDMCLINCTGEVQAGTGISGWYQLVLSCWHQLDHALYKYENIKYVEVPEDHIYNTQNSERSDEVSPYLMVAYVQVPLRIWLLLLLLLLFSSHYCVLGDSINR